MTFYLPSSSMLLTTEGTLFLVWIFVKLFCLCLPFRMATLLGTWVSCWDGRSRFAVIGLCLNLVETPVEAVYVYCLEAENFSRVFRVTLEVLAETLLYCNVLAYLWFWELAICLASIVRELFAGLFVLIVCSMSSPLIFSLSGFISAYCALRSFIIKS